MVTDLTTLVQAVDSAAAQPPTITIALAVLGSSVVAGLISVILGNTRANATARRERYAQAVRTLVAWAEYPYRIRRRTSDDAATLTALADRGHTLQEQLAESRAWIAAESRAMSEVFDACLADINPLVGPACAIAWQQPPITKSAEMLLGDFGPRGINAIVARMECAIIYRFGLRRLMWRRWVLRRLRHRACLPVTPRTTAE
ncbi:hypothetical protein OG598_12140 [Micromonospora sp. NBC_00330]|uniref:hypothetical protein n=1 Tax=Micromonospora sp. NBC_00330 TaxID=2903585 RepID=UPI002E27FC50|nr:hypothetical protein [Micromonospora sp. NBC_00330]